MHPPQSYFELAKVLEAWPKLPLAIRAAILAMVRALPSRDD